MSPALARSAPGEINHWWSHLRFRLKHKKGWNQMLDETFLLQEQKIKNIPLFLATKENNVGCIKKLLSCPSTNTFERGALGETALHVAALSDNVEAAVALMDQVPELINEPMNSDFYQGMTALHIAVVNQNVNLVRELMRRGGDVDTPRVTGMYFRKRRGSLVYFGEHILAFACCLGNEEIINMLINGGANIRAQDSLGNTILHILVLQPNRTIACQVVDLLLSRDAEKEASLPLDMVPNYRGVTPFKLAAKEGNIVAFQHLVKRRRILQWQLGPLTSNLYDLTEIDSLSDSESVLKLVLGSQKREARQILGVTPVRQLVTQKWNLYGKYYFRLLLLLYLLYICTFTLCCMHRPLTDIPYNEREHNDTVKKEKPLRESYVTYQDRLRLVGEVISVAGAFLMLFLEIPDMVRFGAKCYFGQTALGGPFHVILVCYAALVVILCVLRTTETPGESVLMALCLVLGWSNIMFFARGFETMSPYVIMIQKIIFGDLTKFMWLSIIFLIGFSTALWMVYMTQEGLPSYLSFPITLFSQFELSVGLIDLPVDHERYTPPIVHVLHWGFSVFSYTLLLNLLIAVMSETHLRVVQEQLELWHTHMVAITLMLERRLPQWLCPRLGVEGILFGLGEHWYLRVEDRNDPLAHMEGPVKTASSSDEVPGEGSAQVSLRKGDLRASRRRWHKIRQSTFLVGTEDSHFDEGQDIQYV